MLPSHEETYDVQRYVNAQQQSVELRAGKERVCNSLYDNKIISIYPTVFQIYTPCRLVDFYYLCILLLPTVAQYISDIPLSAYTLHSTGHLHYPWISICPLLATLYQTEW